MKPTQPPKFFPGDIVVTSELMGVINGAFWDKKQKAWQYIIKDAVNVAYGDTAASEVVPRGAYVGEWAITHYANGKGK